MSTMSMYIISSTIETTKRGAYPNQLVPLGFLFSKTLKPDVQPSEHKKQTRFPPVESHHQLELVTANSLDIATEKWLRAVTSTNAPSWKCKTKKICFSAVKEASLPKHSITHSAQVPAFQCPPSTFTHRKRRALRVLSLDLQVRREPLFLRIFLVTI